VRRAWRGGLRPGSSPNVASSARPAFPQKQNQRFSIVAAEEHCVTGAAHGNLRSPAADLPLRCWATLEGRSAVFGRSRAAGNCLQITNCGPVFSSSLTVRRANSSIPPLKRGNGRSGSHSSISPRTPLARSTLAASHKGTSECRTRSSP